ncbi:PIN domain-containing protein [Chlorogloeopsis fritschii PCC 9212]|uniref:DNA-binding protein n=1 Tax=Chlorogloeopsis fritschii PCC 6912 TaxID=211165 RepID=A0A3S0ZD16_CHLFR|nr:PIN domain-containing protein [Chlorogloeopsis fritschii]RUR73784.1 DNA-binding protein [Chlorogloeopsis fritschii PCC 6912]
MRVLIDTNIVLDFLLEREPFFSDAEALFQALGAGQVVGYFTATTLTDIFYIAKRQTQSIERARQIISIILAVMEICPVDRIVLEVALMSGLADFEDAVQIACAIAQGLDAIVTRDRNFSNATMPVLSVNQLLKQL